MLRQSRIRHPRRTPSLSLEPGSLLWQGGASGYTSNGSRQTDRVHLGLVLLML